MTSTAAQANLRALLSATASGDSVTSFLNALAPDARVREVLSLHGSEVARLYDVCGGGATPTLEDIVPASLGDDKTVIFHGRNSLPAFSSFQKRFARLGGEIVGYNHQAMAFITGPGVFLVKEPHAESDVPGELYFDYTAIPAAMPSGFPAFKRNDSGLSTLVYAHMKDYMRVVANGVMVGTAFKKGKAENAFFILAREV